MKAQLNVFAEFENDCSVKVFQNRACRSTTGISTLRSSSTSDKSLRMSEDFWLGSRQEKRHLNVFRDIPKGAQWDFSRVLNEWMKGIKEMFLEVFLGSFYPETSGVFR